MKSKGATRDKQIITTAFKYFLEKGYEATSLRTLCSEVGIKIASFYFYYKSKKDLFVAVYEHINDELLLQMDEIINASNGSTALEQLHKLFVGLVTESINSNAKFKFLLRYRLFPPEEVLEDIHLLSRKWKEDEYQLYKKTIEACLVDYTPGSSITSKHFYTKYKRTQDGLIYEMLISGYAISLKNIDAVWNKMCSNLLNIKG